ALTRVTRGVAASCGRRWRCGCLRRSCHGERARRARTGGVARGLRVHRVPRAAAAKSHVGAAGGGCPAWAAGGIRPSRHHTPARGRTRRQRPGGPPCRGPSRAPVRTCTAARGSDGRARRALRLARVAWSATAVWGHTRNRSYEAFLRNKPEWTPPAPVTPGLDATHRAVNPLWTLLRVDQRGRGADSVYRPAGALSVFAVHGTADAPENELLD